MSTRKATGPPVGRCRSWAWLLPLLSALAAVLTACSAGPAPAPPSTAPGGPTASPARPLSAAPRLVFATREHDFGQVSSQGPKIDYRFPFTNTGTGPLQIGTIKLQPAPGGSWAWGVTAVASSATLNPGEAGAVLITIDRPMAGMPGVQLVVPSNDPVEPAQTLTLKFQSVP